MEGMNGLERVRGGENGCRGLAVIFTQSLLGFHGDLDFFLMLVLICRLKPKIRQK